ncbi:MAG: hypothetical protein KatS3mg087_0573 [Patescibacteria group bacterium]|nr:MAG: hypothetical protein KatS3mg087_0573 [Patescibacteria group bacterium]
MQPPIPNSDRPTVELVIEDFQMRSQIGLKKYGAYLQPFNGRRSLQDLYEELSDAVLYCKNRIIEEDAIASEYQYPFPDVYLLMGG